MTCGCEPADPLAAYTDLHLWTHRKLVQDMEAASYLAGRHGDPTRRVFYATVAGRLRREVLRRLEEKT